jgi:RNA-directed DNA polymerase
MGLLDFLRKRQRGRPSLTPGELARRLDLDIEQIAAVRPRYQRFTIRKRGGGLRTIDAPSEELKRLQRRILRRVLALLVVHPAVHGFERGRSIVTNARLHVGRSVVVRLDIRDFFNSTGAKRVEKFFRRIGWDRPAARLLTGLCTHEGGLPQGAPTSPRLANLVNYKLDTRLDHLAAKAGAMYSRYADDLTFSFDRDEAGRVRALIRTVQRIVENEGYRLHKRRKLHVRRPHQRQIVTGVVVNERPNLPRETRRWLRAVEHRLATRGEADLTPEQLAGWRAYRQMIAADEWTPRDASEQRAEKPREGAPGAFGGL